MALNFPSSPNINDTFTGGGRIWTWDGSSWRGVTINSSVPGSNGQLIYSNNGNAAATSDLIYDPVNDRVGIGNTAPLDKLSVNGTSYFGANVNVVGTVNSTAFSGNGSLLTSVDAATVGGNTASTLRSYSDTQATTAYNSAVTYTDTKIGTANSAITGNAATAYSNAVTYADTKAGAAYSNAVAYTDTQIGTVNTAITSNASAAYSNAVTYIDGKILTANGAITGNAATAYTNAVSYTDTRIGTVNTAITTNASAAYSNAVSYTDTRIGTVNTAITTNASAAYSNAVTYTDGKILTANGAITGNAATAYTNAVSYTDSKILTANAAITGNAATAYTNATSFASNGSNISSGTVAFARLPTVDAVNNTSITLLPTANNVKTAYDAAIAANTRAASAQTAAAAAYTNAVSYTDTKIGTANAAITSNAATAYTNAVSYTDTKIGTANAAITGNATTAYTNAVSYTDTKIGTANAAITGNAATAYSNAVSYTDSKILTANSAITGNAATAYTNAVSYTDSKILTANAAITGNAATAYTNATTFASNASNLSTGTVAEARLPYRMDQNVRTSDTVSFSNITITGNLTVQGTTTTVNTATLSVQDNMIYLNANNTVTNPDMGFAGNYNDGTYHHAGFFRDASDGVWKVFDSYEPEPDASAYIDTANNTFHLANFQANVVYVGNTTVYSTINTTSFSGTANNALYLGGSNLSTIQGQITSNASAAYSNAVSYTDTKIGTANTAMVANASAAYSNAVTYIDTKIGTANTAMIANASAAYSNAVTYTDTKIGTANTAMVANASAAYSNAVTYTDTKIGTANTAMVANASAAYSNAVTYIDTKIGTANTAMIANAAAAYTNATTFASNASNLSTGTVPYARIPANVINTTADFTISGVHTHSANIILGSSGLSANGGFGTAGQVLHSNGTATYWAADDDTNTTYDLLAVANTAVNSGIIRLKDSASANDDVLVTGTGTTTVSSNATHIIVNSADQYTGTVTSVTGGSGLTGSVTTTGSLAVGAGSGITVNADDVAVNAQTGLVANATGLYVNAAYIGTISANNASYLGGTIASSYQLNSTLSANVATLTANNTTYAFGKTEGNLNVNAASQLTTSRTIGDVSFNGTANIAPERITYKDTRGTNFNPFTYAGVTLHLKTNTTDSLSDGGTYHGVLDITQWSDSSGGVNHQLGLTDNNNLYIRSSTGASTWSSWSRLYREGSVLTPAANVAMGNNYVVAPAFQAYSEYVSTNATATGATTLDLSTSNFFNLTLTGSITLTFSNAPSGRMFSFTFVAKQDATGGRTITWPTGTKWSGGVVPPATTTANAIDIWSVMTYDGGTTWIASLSVKNAS